MSKPCTKRLGILRKKEGISDAEFREHWLHTHAALCQKLPNCADTGEFCRSDAVSEIRL